ncbi:MAG: hypothetical protein QM723_19485 [Myxococcaceae bacterium]
MKKLAIVAVVLVSGLAFADEAKLSCPAGTRQAGGSKSQLEATLCMKVLADGSRVFHGPYIAWWPNGQQQAVGQNEEGWRTGHWVFFDQNGVKTGDTDFVHGDFHGKRIQYWSNGKVMMEEQYDHGRQLSVKTFDQNGVAIAPQQLGVQVRK